MKIKAIVIAILMMSTLFVLAEDTSKETPVERMVGDWILTKELTMENTTLILQGNLYVEGGGLTLINSTLIMDSYVQGQFGIFVESGFLALYNSTITANNTNHYFIIVKDGSRFSALNSTIEYAGYEDGERSGLYVEGDVKLNNTTFRYDYCPLWAYRIKDTEISDIKVYQNQYGVKLVECRNLTMENLNINTNSRTGIWLKGGKENVIQDCRIENIYRPSGSPLAYGVIIENESLDTVKENTIGNIGKDAILLKGEASMENTVENNTIFHSGNAGIHVYMASETLLYNNNFSSIWRAVLIEKAENSTLKEDKFSSRIGIAVYDSKNTLIIKERLENVEVYGIMLYSSNTTYIYALRIINCTYALYVKNSVVFFNGHLYPDRYFVVGKSRLYFTLWRMVRVYDYMGRPLKGVRLKLIFLGETIAERRTYATGATSFYVPYVLQTPGMKRYSWCEIVAEGNISFEENPIRFYPWEKDEIVFREKVPGLNVSIFADKEEASPGERVNITIIVRNGTGFVGNASVDVSLNGKPVFPPEYVGNGTYITSVELPEFNSSLRIHVSAAVGNQTGNASFTIMRPSLPYKEGRPGKTISQSSFSTELILAIILFLAIVVLVVLRRRNRGGLQTYRPLSPEKIEVER